MMLALVAALLIAQAPDPATAAPLTPQPLAPQPLTPLAPDFSACLALLEAGDQEGARACYAACAVDPSAPSADEAALARELADVVSSLKLPERPEALVAPTARPFDLGLLATSGKAELIVTSALAGGYAAELAVMTLLLATNGGGLGSVVFVGILLAPVGGALAGLAASTAMVLAIPEITAGDANVVRAFLLLGAFDSVMAATSMLAYGVNSGGGAPVSAAMLLAQGAAAGAGVGVAALFDLPEGAGSAAVSGALWTSLLSMLTVNMFEGLKGDSRGALPLIALTGNAGFAGALVLTSTLLPVSRADTWALDVGGAVGVLGGAALALGLRAPNPFLGYGAMAVGCVGGLAAGVAAARLVPGLIDAIPNVLVMAPLAVPPMGGDAPPIGMAFAGRF